MPANGRRDLIRRLKVNVTFITQIFFMELVWNIVKYNFMFIMKELVSSYFIQLQLQ